MIRQYSAPPQGRSQGSICSLLCTSASFSQRQTIDWGQGLVVYKHHLAACSVWYRWMHRALQAGHRRGEVPEWQGRTTSGQQLLQALVSEQARWQNVLYPACTSRPPTALHLHTNKIKMVGSRMVSFGCCKFNHVQATLWLNTNIFKSLWHSSSQRQMGSAIEIVGLQRRFQIENLTHSFNNRPFTRRYLYHHFLKQLELLVESLSWRLLW